MKMYKYVWKDGAISVVCAPSKDSAIERLEETYEDIEEERLFYIPHFLATFHKVPVVDEGKDLAGWDVSFDESTEKILMEDDEELEGDEEDEE